MFLGKNFVYSVLCFFVFHSTLVSSENTEEVSFLSKSELVGGIKTVCGAFFTTIAVAYAVKWSGLNGSSNVFNSQLADSIESSLKIKDYVGEVPKEVKSLIRQLKDEKMRERYKEFNVPLPKGFLFVGPPGTGKTLLASVIAGELGVPFFAPKNLESKWWGETQNNIIAIFKQAKQAAVKNSRNTAIIFFDEIETIAGSRAGLDGNAVVQQCNKVNTLLDQMDGISNKEGVIENNKSFWESWSPFFRAKQENPHIIVIGATNDSKLVDPAVLSRLKTVIEIPLPSVKTIAKIMQHYIKKDNTPVSEKMPFDFLSNFCVEMSSRDVEDICQNAKKFAAEDVSAEAVLQKHILRAITNKKLSKLNSEKNFLQSKVEGHVQENLILHDYNDDILRLRTEICSI